MDAHEEESSLLLKSDSALEEKEGEGEEEDDYYYEEEEEEFGNDHGCSCFRFFCVGGRERENRDDQSLWRRKVKELKEITELLFGPKWKNIIRKLSVYAKNNKNKRRQRKMRRMRRMRKRSKAQFHQYDPESYALNFEHGSLDDDDEEDEDALRRNFSSRFAAAPSSKINTSSSTGF